MTSKKQIQIRVKTFIESKRYGYWSEFLSRVSFSHRKSNRNTYCRLYDFEAQWTYQCALAAILTQDGVTTLQRKDLNLSSYAANATRQSLHAFIDWICIREVINPTHVLAIIMNAAAWLIFPFAASEFFSPDVRRIQVQLRFNRW